MSATEVVFPTLLAQMKTPVRVKPKGTKHQMSATHPGLKQTSQNENSPKNYVSPKVICPFPVLTATEQTQPSENSAKEGFLSQRDYSQPKRPFLLRKSRQPRTRYHRGSGFETELLAVLDLIEEKDL